jgi:hypothetical protein
LLAATFSAATLTFPAIAARADSGSRIDVELNSGSTAYSDTRLTLGGGALFGYRVETAKVWFQPEAGAHYTALTSVGCACSALTHTVRVTGGARVGAAGLVAGLIEPSLFGHVGYGFLAFEVSKPYPFGPPMTETATASALAADVGLSLDAHATQRLRVGVHGGYNALKLIGKGSPTPGETWVSLGLHLGVQL